jgi:hypothetical protein
MWLDTPFNYFSKSPSFKTEISLSERVDAKRQMMQGASIRAKEPTLQAYPFDR